MVFSLSLSAIKYVKADSGFDSSYDGGGSSSSSDFGSSSSSGGSGGSSGNPLPGLAICCIAILAYVKIASKKAIQENIIKNKEKYHSITDDTLRKTIPMYTTSTIKNITLSLLSKSRDLICSNDIDGLKSISSFEQVESYLKTIEKLKAKNLNLEYKKMKFLDFIVFDVKEENNKVLVKTYLNIYAKCFLINKDTKERKKYRCYEAIIVELTIDDKVKINREETIKKDDAYSESKSSQKIFVTKVERSLRIFYFTVGFSLIFLLALIYNDLLSLLMLFIIFRFTVMFAKSCCNSNKNFVNQVYDYYDLTDKEIKKHLKDYDSEKLKEEIFTLYKDIQVAWMNFDYDKLRELCTDELYNAYKAQLETLKLKHRKNIMEDITYMNSRILNINIVNNTVSVDSYMIVKTKDYIVDDKSGSIERGSKDYQLLAYRLTVVKGLDSKEQKCPNCGAKVDLNTSSKCEYCGSTIVIPPKKFVLSKKSLNERDE